jgi:hypothetical protein
VPVKERKGKKGKERKEVMCLISQSTCNKILEKFNNTHAPGIFREIRLEGYDVFVVTKEESFGSILVTKYSAQFEAYGITFTKEDSWLEED